MRKRDPGESCLALVHDSLALPVHTDAVDRPAQVADVDTFIPRAESDSNRLVQMSREDVSLRHHGQTRIFRPSLPPNIRHVQRVPSGMLAAICPPEGLAVGFDSKVDAFGEVGEEELDVCPGRWGLASGHGHIGSEDAAFTCFAGAFLGPVEDVVTGIDRHADAEAERVADVVRVGGIAGLDEDLLVGAVEVASMNT